jgi:carboxypeptidase C (cathepsin A)
MGTANVRLLPLASLTYFLHCEDSEILCCMFVCRGDIDMFRTLTVFVSLMVTSVFLTLSTAQEPPPAQTKNKPATQPAKAETKAKAGEPAKEKKETSKSSTDEEPVITHHTVRVGGQDLKYTTTAGLMPIRDAKGDVEARIFFIAHTLDDVKAAASRPLLFSFNGGPGSASLWLHMGALGPRRVPAPAEPTIPAPPFHLVDNDASWLDKSDLVFIDPVGTGFSRAAKPELNNKFHSLNGDIESVGEFIRMYLTRYDRWDSPLYLIGESYGTTRAAGLAGHLVDRGIVFNGVILVSCALDFQGFSFSPGNDLVFLNYLPSYAAVAWYHHKLPADLQQVGLPAVLQEVERWTDREYASILARGDRLSAGERRDAVARLARYTGLSAEVIDEHQLRIELSVFRKELLKSQHRSIGRFDARYQGIENLTPSDSGPSTDASYSAVRAPYTATFYRYLRSEVGYRSDVPYYVLGEGVGRWNFQSEMGYPATTHSLSAAMAKNPHMKVLIASGYYDLATPYRAVEQAIAGLGLDPVLRKNLTVETYDAGHMMYLHEPSLHKLKHDGAAFIERSRGK